MNPDLDYRGLNREYLKRLARQDIIAGMAGLFLAVLMGGGALLLDAHSGIRLGCALLSLYLVIAAARLIWRACRILENVGD